MYEKYMTWFNNHPRKKISQTSRYRHAEKHRSALPPRHGTVIFQNRVDPPPEMNLVSDVIIGRPL